jgi:hypothetical protein
MYRRNTVSLRTRSTHDIEQQESALASVWVGPTKEDVLTFILVIFFLSFSVS